MSTDLNIDKCQKFLENQFNALNKLQDNVLGQNLMFHEQKRKFLQILYNGLYHWVKCCILGL